MSAPEHVLVMRVCRADMTSRDGFRWPESGLVEAPDWRDDKECGHGLHGWLWGEGDISSAGDVPTTPGARWLVVRVLAAEIRDLRDKVKFPRGEVVFAGEAHEAAYYLATHGAVGRAIIHGASSAGNGGTATAGDGGTATAGDGGTATAGTRGTATAGDGGTATAGDGGTIQIEFWDRQLGCYRKRVGEVINGGLEASVAYRLDADGTFVRGEREVSS